MELKFSLLLWWKNIQPSQNTASIGEKRTVNGLVTVACRAPKAESDPKKKQDAVAKARQKEFRN